MADIDKYLVDLIEDIAGEEVVALVNLMSSKPRSEFKLAERLKETVNRVRNMLYKLYSYNLVDFIRKKDRKKGWYIYYWSFDIMKALVLALDFKKKRVEHLKIQLVKEKELEYFVCKNDDTRMNLEDAMEHDFRCPECDDLLVRDENVKIVSNIGKEIGKLQKEIVEVNEILGKEKEKELKKIEREKKRKVSKPKKRGKRRGRPRKRRGRPKKKKRGRKRKKKKVKKHKKKVKKRKAKKKIKKRKKKRRPKKKKRKTKKRRR